MALGQSKNSHKKDAQGFWHDQESAIKQASQTKKPLLIDFYGIWCPPCNQLNELVFSHPEFKKIAKNYVLLKLDADHESSWGLKSQYKVGGYPTIILARAEDNQATQELDRLVGYQPINVFTQTMKEALSSDPQTTYKEKSLAVIDKAIRSALDQDEFDQALPFIEAALALDSQNLKYSLLKLKVSHAQDKKILKNKESQKIITQSLENRKQLSTEQLVDLFYIKMSPLLIEELLSRLNTDTLYIENSPYTEADIWSMKYELAEEENNKEDQKQALIKTIESYEKLLKKYGEYTRSLNMGYIYYLALSEDVTKTEAVIKKIVSQYPEEFTFHYQAAKIYWDKKNLIKAKEHIQSAVDYSYGDNKLRSLDRALQIAVAESQDQVFLKRMIKSSESFIQGLKSTENLKIRTEKYLKKLKESLEKAKGLVK